MMCHVNPYMTRLIHKCMDAEFEQLQLIIAINLVNVAWLHPQQ